MGKWLHANRNRILETWEAQVRLIVPSAKPVDSQKLTNSIPDLFDNLIATTEDAEGIVNLGRVHGDQRSRIRGYDLEFVIEEYQALRRVIFKVAREHGVVGVKDNDAILDAIGMAIRNATSEFNKVRAAQLTASKIEAENANQAKSTFLANMSHEIRTPLGAILGYADLLKDSQSNVERTNFIKVINRQGKVLSSLIDDILDLSKIEAGHLDIEHIDFRLLDLVQESMETFSKAAKAKGILLTAEVDPETPLTITSDPTRLGQILTNILGNAIKFTKAGFIKVSVKRVGSKISFRIADSGIGMSVDEAATLFKPFSQVDPSMTRKYGGTGLGLILSRQLASALGGNVVLLQSAKGSTFEVTIEAQEPTNILIEKEKLSAIFDSHIKVLLVEDSLDNQDYIKRLLERKGITVAVANDGKEGVEMVHTGEYDIVLMDVQMPILNGYQATRVLRSEGYTKAIVALTAHALPEDRKKSKEAGCDGHLTKPVDQALLFNMIHDLQSQRSFKQGRLSVERSNNAPHVYINHS
jgi:signal transduction histidine kinase/ActR/RegA family two-component response regulator